MSRERICEELFAIAPPQHTYLKPRPYFSSMIRKATHQPISFLLDNVRSAQNVGATFRIADAFLIEKIYCCGITPHPPHPQIHKTALGAEEKVAWQHETEVTLAMEEFKKRGYTLVAVEQREDAIPLECLHKHLPPTPLALIFGHEVFGVSQEALDRADVKCVIPQYGVKKSLNIATCVGIVAWELVGRK